MTFRSSFCRLLAVIALPLAFAGTAVAEDDAAGCKEHALFPNRMPGFHIDRCENKDFDSVEFENAKQDRVPVEGRVTIIRYVKNESAQEPSRLQIQRNYQNAFTRIGGAILVPDHDGNTVMRLIKGKSETWVAVDAYVTFQYTVTIVEKGGMNQDITADPAALSADLKSAGHTAIYGILFDTGKADIKPESSAALDQIAGLLKSQPALKVHIVGHTDNVGNLDANMKLSQARADSVVQTLVAKYGIDKTRLRAFGVASLSPVASNADEAGRAKNRRVELVQP